MTKMPEPSDIASDFQVLDDEYAEEGYYGGAFEGSHTYADAIIFHLYSIVPGGDAEADGERLRIETRHHISGRVLAHEQESRPLTDDGTVGRTDQPIESFCRRHHNEAAHEEMVGLLEAIDE